MRGTRPRLAVFFPPAFSAPTVLPDPRPSDSPIPQSPVPNDPACPARQDPGHTVSPCSASRPEPLGSPAPSSARFIRNEKSFIRIRYRPKRITFTFVKQTQSGTTMKTKPSAIKSLLAAALAASCLASYAAAPETGNEIREAPKGIRRSPAGIPPGAPVGLEHAGHPRRHRPDAGRLQGAGLRRRLRPPAAGAGHRIPLRRMVRPL